MKHLKIGDIFTDNGFLSTTRNPFYTNFGQHFGHVLVKIKIPANAKGVALCIETVSNFAEEEEIIFAPGTKFKLVSKDKKVTYYHTNQQFNEQVFIKYEFEYVQSS